MKAIVLAAGLGTRLGAMTERLPKCLVEVAGKSVLRRNLEWAAANGVNEVAVNLHHRAPLVRGHFALEPAPLPVHWSHEPELLGTAGTLHSLRDWVGEERFAVIYADNLIACDLTALAALHVRRDARATVALFEREDVSQSGVAELSFRDRIIRFVEKPAPGQSPSHWVSAGLIVFDAAVAQLAPARGDIGRDLLPTLLERGEHVAGYRMSQSETLHWIDTPDDLERTRSVFAGALG